MIKIFSMNRVSFYIVFFAVVSLILSGCAVRNLTYGNPPVVFAYPETIPIIKDASKVATIVTRGDVFMEAGKSYKAGYSGFLTGPNVKVMGIPTKINFYITEEGK